MAAKKQRERRVDELLNAAELILVPQITPVLKGIYCMHGPVDETDQDSEQNMIPLNADKRSGKRSMRRKVRTSAESGTCNVCSAPCSSCMHLKLARMGSKGGEMSDETCHVAVMSQNSIFDNQQHTASETSNLLSVNSSHDSFSENAESKVNTRSSDVAETSVESKMLPQLISGGAVGEDQLIPKLQCSSVQRAFSNKLDDLKAIEGLDDNISCVSRANDVSRPVSYSRKNVDRMNLLGKSGSVSSSGQEACGEAASIAVKGGNSAANNSTDSFLCAKITVDKDTVKVASKICPQLEAEDKDSTDQPEKVLNCSDQTVEEKKFDASVELPVTQEPVLQSVSGDESNEAEIMEHDVKVCDICGDAGREDLLAICNRCTDGAEHTYCMREMLQKVPEGYWLCEECKLAEELENQKQGLDAEEKTAKKVSCQISGKRCAETTEVPSSSKRQAIETISESPKSSSPGRTATLSREGSFKSSENGKVKSTHLTSLGNQSSIDLLETARHVSTGPRLQSPRGVLSKSSSFNALSSKPKAKLADEVPQKFKGAKESSLDSPTRMMSKSMSFKSVNSGRSITSESKVKMLPSKFSHVPELKGLKAGRDRNVFERKNLSRLDRPYGVSVAKVDQRLTPRGDSSIISSANNSKELKVSQSDGKSGNLSRSNSIIARKGTELPVIPARVSPVNGTSNASIDSSVNQICPKDEPSSSSSWIAERSPNNDNENLPECSPRPRDPSVQGEKAKENSGSHLRPGVKVSSRNMTCQKCKEVGHAAECCTVSPWVPGVNTSVTRTVRGDVSGGSKLKAAIEAAMLKKPGIYRKKWEMDQSDGLSSSNTDGSFSAASQDQLPVSNKIKEINSDEETTDRHAKFRMLSSKSYKQISINNLKQIDGHAFDGSFPVKVEEIDSVVQSVGKLSHASASTSTITKTLAIPNYEYIWQGAFEVCKSGRRFEWCGEIQAHLSTCASPKVLEVVKRFPQKLTLDEVPRLSTWPKQFHVNGAKEDNIALFFFAKDVESFEKHYKGLLDNMIREDLALKGSFDGVDLLIFPSTQLPESSQRWNMLFFFWGVFRGRSDCSESLKKSVTSNLDAVPLDKESSSAVMSFYDDSCLPKSVDKESSASDCSSDKGPTVNAHNKQCIQTNGKPDKKVSSLLLNSEQQDCGFDSKYLSNIAKKSPLYSTESRCTSPSHEEVGLVECKPVVELKSSTQTNGSDSSSNGREEMQMKNDASHSRGSVSSSKVSGGASQDSSSGGSLNVGRTTDRIGSHSPDGIKVERDLNVSNENTDTEGPLERDLNTGGIDTWHSNPRKRQYLDLSEAVAQTCDDTSDQMQWNKVAGNLDDGESTSKKSKSGFSGLYGSSSSRDGISMSDKVASKVCDLASSSSSEDKSCAEAYDEKVALEKLGSSERYFFPIDSHAKDSWLGANSMPWKEYMPNEDNQSCDGVPNLELALGAETKSVNRGLSPLFVGISEKNTSLGKPPDRKIGKEEEDGVSPSLSLSLSFPFPDKEQTTKPVPKPEQLLPERRRVNTSLFLFGDLSDK